MTPQELKTSLLHMAMEGKLVEQRSEEGSARSVLELAFSERDALIRKKILKKEASIPAIAEDEIPFDVPEGWILVRLNDIVKKTIKRGKSPTYAPQSKTLVFAQKCNVKTGGINMGLAQYLDESKLEKYPADEFMQDSDIIVNSTGNGTLGRVGIFHDSDNPLGLQIVPDSHVTIIRVCSSILAEYIFYFLKYCQPYLESLGAGSTNQTELRPDILKNLVVGLPPLAEQKRIVEKIEELLPLIDRYDAAWTKLENFNQRFPVDMKKSILQMAIQGKLVPQDPLEGTGEDLYEMIQAEEDRLIEAGIIKREKPLDDITEEEIPFDIPDTWTWVKFGKLGRYKKGPFGSALTKSMFVPKGDKTVKVYEQKNAIHKNATLGEYYISREYFETKMTGFEVHPGDIIVSCAGTIGETYVLPDNIEQGIINQALMRMQLFQPMYIPYFLMFFDVVLKQNARSGSKGSAIKNIPPFEVLKNYPVPIPPLAEQKRIVAKLDEILPLCEGLR